MVRGHWRWHPRVDRDLTVGQRAADRVAALVGSWPFIIVQTFLLAAWIVVNARVLPRLLGGGVFAELPVWDRYPFILLNLMLSFQAAYTGPIVMISQNRADQKRAELAQHDFDNDAAALAAVQRIDQRTGEILSELRSSRGA
jgi:uncharacterized membrane protein